MKKYKDTEEDIFEFLTEIAVLFEELKEKPSYYHYLRFVNIDITINNREKKIYKKEQFEHIIKILKGNNLGIYITQTSNGKQYIRIREKMKGEKTPFFNFI